MTVVGIDAGALSDTKPTGVSRFVRELTGRLRLDDDLDLREYAVGRVRPGPNARHHRAQRVSRHIPGSWQYRWWLEHDWPPAQLWTGADVEVVHGTNYFVPPAGRAATLVSVHDVHDLSNSEFPQAGQLLERALGRGAHVHCISEATSEHLRAEFDVDGDRVHVVPLGAPEKRPFVRPIAERESTIVAFGDAIARKNFVELIRAMAEIRRGVPDARLVIAARGVDSTDYGRRMKWEVDALGLGSAVTLHDWVSNEPREELLDTARVLAYPSLMEGFGFPILEGMAAGCAVVVSGRGSTLEVAGEAALESGVAAEGIAAAVLRAFDDDVALRLTGAADHQLAKFSWENTTRSIKALYEQLAKY